MDSKIITLDQYRQLALRAECNYTHALTALADHKKLRILHACMGLSSEAGEFTEMLKKHLFYGKPFDFINAIEESGDIMWYMAVLWDAMGIRVPELEILERNILKLKERYPGKYSDNSAINRNTNRERKILEG
jgi:NTP pyrophosphatase (non-canonical NTP hydrolase)